MFTDNYMGGSFPHWQTAPVRRTWKSWVKAGRQARIQPRVRLLDAFEGRCGMFVTLWLGNKHSHNNLTIFC